MKVKFLSQTDRVAHKRMSHERKGLFFQTYRIGGTVNKVNKNHPGPAE